MPTPRAASHASRASTICLSVTLHPLHSWAHAGAGGTIAGMRIDWKSRRTQLVGAAVLFVLLAVSIWQGAFRDWHVFDYIGWWVALPLLVLLFATLVTYLVRAWGGGRRED